MGADVSFLVKQVFFHCQTDQVLSFSNLQYFFFAIKILINNDFEKTAESNSQWV